MVKIGRHINGITLNPLEWLEDKQGNIKKFKNQKEAEQFLLNNGENAENLEWYTFEEVKQ